MRERLGTEYRGNKMLNEKEENKLTTRVNDLIVTKQYKKAQHTLDKTNAIEYKHFDRYQNMLQTCQAQVNHYNEDIDYSPEGV